MSKKDWLIVVGVIVVSLLFDVLSRWFFSIALKNNDFMLGPIGLVFLEGVHLSNVIGYKKIIFSVILSSISLIIFCTMNLMLVQRLLGFRVGLALITSGLMVETVSFFWGNKVTAWLVFFKIYLNLVDIYLIIGALITIFFCIKCRSTIFHKNNLRTKIFTDPGQYVFCFFVLFTYFIFTISAGMFFILFLKLYSLQTNTSIFVSENNTIGYFLVLFFLLFSCFFFVMLLAMVYFSNKIYGPVYAFKKYVRNVILAESPEDRPFNLRKGDHFRDLVNLAKELKGKYGKKKQ